MRTRLTIASSALLVIAAGLPTANAQQPPKAIAAADPAIKVVDPDLRAALPDEGRVNIRVDDFPSRYPADGPWHANHEMRLRSDGNLPGQLRAFDAAGNLTPVRARLFFIQNEQVVGRAASDEMGRFQIVGIPPGAYSIVVASSEALGALSLRVLESGNAQTLPPPKVKSITEPHLKQVSSAKKSVSTAADFLTLDISLVPASHFSLVSQIIREQIPNFPLGAAGRGAATGLGALGAGAGAGIGGGGGAGLSSALGAAAAGGAAAALGASQKNNATAQTTESNGGS